MVNYHHHIAPKIESRPKLIVPGCNVTFSTRMNGFKFQELVKRWKKYCNLRHTKKKKHGAQYACYDNVIYKLNAQKLRKLF